MGFLMARPSMFTPDATRAEAEQIVLGWTNTAKEIDKHLK